MSNRDHHLMAPIRARLAALGRDDAAPMARPPQAHRPATREDVAAAKEHAEMRERNPVAASLYFGQNSTAVMRGQAAIAGGLDAAPEARLELLTDEERAAVQTLAGDDPAEQQRVVDITWSTWRNDSNHDPDPPPQAA